MSKHHSTTRVLAALLSALMTLSAAELPVWAVWVDERQEKAAEEEIGFLPSVLHTQNGDVEIDEDWNAVYPYGTFAFGTYQADVAEPGALTAEGEEIPQTVLIPVYRLGGTVGRVTAKIQYSPAVTTDPDGIGTVYDYAASGKLDLLIEYEAPTAMAASQPAGLPESVRNMLPADAAVSFETEGITAETLTADDELSLFLTGDPHADAYTWQARVRDGDWQDIEGGVNPTLPAAWGEVWDFENDTWNAIDFRCIYCSGGQLYCTESLFGERYEPLVQPKGISFEVIQDLAETGTEEDPAFTVLAFDEEFDAYEFLLTFAEGETLKYIRVSALDDETPELPELGLFTITGCEGGDVSDTCNTLTLMISDNDDPEPSTVGFIESEVAADRRNGQTSVTVAREGGKSYSVTVNYRTVDGTALAGVDYAPVEGAVGLAGSIDEIRIPIEFIASRDTENKYFTVELTGVLGGGSDDICAIDPDRAVVRVEIAGGSAAEEEVPQTRTETADLYQPGMNLATVLAGFSGENAADRIVTADRALIPDKAVTEGEYLNPEGGDTEILTAAPPAADPGSPMLQTAAAFAGTPVMPNSFVLSSGFGFSREGISEYAASDYWHDWEFFAGKDSLLDSSSAADYADLFAVSSSEAISVKNVTQTSPLDGHMPKNYIQVMADADGTASLGITGAGYKYSKYIFASYLEEIGIKDNHWLRPKLTVGNEGKSFSTIFYDQKGRIYYWYTDIADNTETTASIYGNDLLNDVPYIDDYDAVTLGLTDDLTLNLDFAVRDKWGDSGSGTGTTSPETLDLIYFGAQRRTFEKLKDGIRAVLYTANDADEAAGNGWTPVKDKALYQSITPTLSIVPGKGGVDQGGHLYAGSLIGISLPSSCKNYIIDHIDVTMAVKNVAGDTVIQYLQVNQTSENTAYAEMIPQIPGAMALTQNFCYEGEGYEEGIVHLNESVLRSDNLRINIFLTRKQTVTVDIVPSVPRSDDNPEAIDPEKIADTWNGLRYGNGYVAEIGYSMPPSLSADGLYYTAAGTKNLTPDEFSAVSGSGGVFRTAARIDNLQWICFHQDTEDVILLNGRAYKGDERIVLTEDCFNLTDLTFTFYDSDYLDAASPMEVLLKQVELYYDGNGDGVIDGTFANGVFTPTAPDERIGTMDGEYSDAVFRPTVIRDDRKNITQVNQYFLKAYFTIRPRSLMIPAGGSAADAAQVIPAMTSTVTDPAQMAELTEEELSYRYIRGGNTDGHPMYGEAASALSYVDIPLGGDRAMYIKNTVTDYIKDSEGRITDVTASTVWTWEPDYLGNLLVPFENPTPVMSRENITGGPVPLAGETAAVNDDGSFAYSTEGLSRMNGYLGSFAGRSGFALVIQQQKTAAASIRDLAEIQPETVTTGSVTTIPSPDSLMNMEAAEDPNGAAGATPDDATGYPAFGADLGVELPTLNFEFGDYATFIMDGYEIGFSIGIPLYKHESTNYSGSEKTVKQDDGSTTKEWVNPETGQKETIITSADGKTTSTTYPKEQDPNDPDCQKQKTVVIRTKDDGSKTEQIIETVTVKTPDPKDPNKTVEKTTKTEYSENPLNTPAATAQAMTRKEKAKEYFKNTHSQMVTLGQFISSVANRVANKQKNAISDFMEGSFEDDSLKQAMNGNGTSKKVQVTFTVQIGIRFEYNPIDNGYYFKNAGLAGTLGLQVTVQHRFSVFPLVYVYVKFGAEIELGVGISCIREAKEGAEVTSFFGGRTLDSLAAGERVMFTLDMTKNGKDTVRGFHLDLSGRVFMEVFGQYPAEGVAPLTSGALSGDGSTNEVLFEAYDCLIYVRLTPIKNGVKSAKNLKPVIGAASKVVFDGINITPGLSLEVGAGIGIELLKFELFARTNIAITLTMEGYSQDTGEYEPFYVSNFDWALALGFHATVLFINYSMDVIGISVNGSETGGTGGYFTWTITAAAADGMKVLWTKTTYTKGGKTYDEPPLGRNVGADTLSQPVRSAPDLTDADSIVHISMQRDVSGTQAVSTLCPASDDPASLSRSSASLADGAVINALPPTGTDDFELSGFNTSGDARKLVDGLAAGYTYKLFRADGETYIIYPLSISGTPQLVMSRIVMTGDLSEGMGLANPAHSASATPYVKLDNDNFPDYDFSADAEGSVVTAVWTSGNREQDPTAEAVTVTKKAVFNLKSGTAFSEPEILSDPQADAYRFQPSAHGDTTVWAESSGTGDTANEALMAYLIAHNEGLSADELEAGLTNNPQLASAVYRWNITSTVNNLSGGQSVLKSSSGAARTLNPGEIIENIETGIVNGILCAAFSTSQTVYFDQNGQTVAASAIGNDTELGTVRRMYFASVENDTWNIHLIQTVIDFDSCEDQNLSTATLKDGIYVNSALSKAQADPYYGNIRFLTADLDGYDTPETFLIFEMGGNTYLVRQDDLQAVLTGGTAVLTPLFETASGTDVTIGSDGRNMAVVFTAPVANTVNNAVYAAWWDTNLGTWGSPILLAMNHLQIYEDSITYNMPSEDTADVYLGKSSTPGGNTGSMNRFTFSNLQMTTLTVPDEKAPDGVRTQLLVLTEGSRMDLREQTFLKGEPGEFTTVIPVEDAQVGFYAIGFGQGEQALSLGSIGFSNRDFTAGSQIVGEVRFENAGTTAIRASAANPACAELKAITTDGENAGSLSLARWILSAPIPSGRSMELNFKSNELPYTLPAGTRLALTVWEDAGCFDNAFNETLDNLFVIEAKAELSFGSFDMKLADVQDEKALLSMEASVLNNGTAPAENVYIQFTCDTGEVDAQGEPIYKPVDISGSALETGREEIQVLKNVYSLNALPANDANGVFHLSSLEDGTAVRPGNLRRIGGTLAVPISSFLDGEGASGLHIRAEIFSDADSTNLDAFGVYSSDHAEYNGYDNRTETTVKHGTFFEIPSRISTALGSTMNLPVRFRSTSANPRIVLTEISDGTEDWTPNMGIAYYDKDRNVIVAAANSTAEQKLANGEIPTGILQIRDESTNSVAAIMYQVLKMADGINIYRDDMSFTFRDAAGNPVGQSADTASPKGWAFVKQARWDYGSGEEIPMNADLSRALEDGATVEFNTVLDTITLYFAGTVMIESDTFDSSPKTFTQAPAFVDFGNDKGKTHTVTITAAKGTELDRYIPTYKVSPVSDTDSEAPQILWNRTPPETASVKTGDSVPMTCYIVDGTGIASVSFNGVTLTESTDPALVKEDGGLCYFDYTFTDNESYDVRATDIVGNTSVLPGRALWFNDVLSAGANAEAPEFVRGHMSFTDGNGNPVSLTDPLNEIQYLSSSYVLRGDETSSAYFFTDGIFSEPKLAKEEAKESWQTVGNGYYMVVAERDDETWARAVRVISNIDVTVPILSVVLNGNGDAIDIAASDNSKIVSVTVNGYEIPGMNGKSVSDSFPAEYGGDYEVIATDDAGNTTVRTVSVEVPIAVDDAVTAEADAEASSAVIKLDPTKVTGGSYDRKESEPSANLYKATYRYALVMLDSENGEPDVSEAEWTDETEFNAAESGTYALAVRDSEGNAAYSGPITVSITAETTEPTCTEDGRTGCTVSVTFDGKTDTDEAVLTLAALGHTYGDPVWKWDGYSAAAAVFTCGGGDDTQTLKANITSVTTDPTCTEAGKTVYTATVVFGETTYTNDKTEPLDPTGHAYALTKFEWAKDSKTAEAVFTCANNKEHVERVSADVTSSVKVPASCEAAGTTTYTASVTFENMTYTDTKDVEDIPTTGHAYELTGWKWTDFTKAAATFTCANDETHIVTVDGTITGVHTDPTDTEAGKDVYTAAVTFENKTYTDTKEDILPPLGHRYGEPEWTWTGYDKATAVFTCDKGDDTQRIEAKITAVTTDPTCEEAGETVYTAAVNFGGKEYKDEKTEALPALGHDWGEPVFRWMPDHSAATALKICRNNAEHVLRFPAEVRTETLPGIGFGPVVTLYTATAVIDGRVYRDTVRVSEPGLIHGYPALPVPHEPEPEKEPAVTVPPTDDPLPFTDVTKADPFYDDVKFVYNEGIMNGVSASRFDPQSGLTRGMIVTVLYRMEGEPEVPEGSIFTDVPAGEWYSDGVVWAASKGIVNGYGDGKYGPTDPVTREQLAAILNRYADFKGYAIETDALDAADAGSVSGWAADNVKWAAANGILETDEKGNIRPTEPASRAEIAHAIRAFLEGSAK